MALWLCKEWVDWKLCKRHSNARPLGRTPITRRRIALCHHILGGIDPVPHLDLVAVALLDFDDFAGRLWLWWLWDFGFEDFDFGPKTLKTLALGFEIEDFDLGTLTLGAFRTLTLGYLDFLGFEDFGFGFR